MLIKAEKEVDNENFSFYGQKLNGSTWALIMMNMFLHGFDNATIRCGDLRTPKLKEDDKGKKIDDLERELSEVQDTMTGFLKEIRIWKLIKLI
jgi:type I restriction-modification system DNA methylase subunit